MSAQQSIQHPSLRRLRIRRRYLVLLILLAALIGAALKGWQLYTDIQALRQDAAELATVVAQPDLPQITGLGPLLARTRSDAQNLRDAAAPLLPITRWLGWLPRYGSDLAAATSLLDAAVELSTAAEDGYIALMPVLRPVPGDQTPAQALAQRLQAAQADLQRVRATLARATDTWADVPLAHLSPALRATLEPIDQLLPAARNGIDLALAAPELMGMHGRREYLVIAQNPDELRPTGGLITAAGVLTLEQGQVVAFSMGDSGTVNNYGNGPYPDAPAPLQHYMGIDLWAFQDANWSPDLPTAAKTITNLYKRGVGRTVQGIITVDPTVVVALLQVTGPLTLPNQAVPLTADTVLNYMRNSVFLGPASNDLERQQQWVSERKAFMAPLATALLQALQHTRPGADWLALGRTFAGLLAERHLQLVFDQPAANTVIARLGWNGALQPGSSDFLMLVDANVGYNKVSASVRQSITYTIDLSQPQAPLAEVQVVYTHQIAASERCDQRRGLRMPVQRYEDMLQGCYYDYLRVYAPGEAQLITALAPAVPGAWMLTGMGTDGTVDVQPGIAGTHEFGALLVTPPSETRRFFVRYRLPTSVVVRDEQGWHYQLKLQKQAGTPPLPATVRVRLPQGTAVLTTSLPAVQHNGQELVFQLMLARDQMLDVVFTAAQ